MSEQGPMSPEVVPWFIGWLVAIVLIIWEFLATGREEQIGYVVRMAPWRWPLSFAWRFCSCDKCTVKREIIETTHKEAIERRKWEKEENERHRKELARKARLARRRSARYPPKPDPLPFPPIKPPQLLWPRDRGLLEWHNPRPNVGYEPWPSPIDQALRARLSEEEKRIILRSHTRSEAEAILLEDMRQTVGIPNLPIAPRNEWLRDLPRSHNQENPK